MHMSKEMKCWILLISLACIWGSSFILMKKAMFTDNGEEIFSDSQVGSLRIAIASFVLLPFAIRALAKLKDFKVFLLLAVVGLFGNFFPAFLFTYAETGISSGYAGMLNSFTPIFALLIGFFFFKDRLTKIQLVGVAIGTIGVVALMLSGRDLSINGGMIHILAIVLATIFYAISLNIIRHKLQSLKSFQISSLSFSIIFLPSIVVSLLNGSVTTMRENPHASEGLIYLGALSIVGTAFAVIIFNRLITLSSVLYASSVTYLIPIVAVIIGFSFNEKINMYQIGSMLIVLLGIFTANVLPKLKKRRNEAIKYD